MCPKLVAVAAWVSMAIVAYATLSPVGVVYEAYAALRWSSAPLELATYVHLEHVVVFALAGALFCLAYPRHLFLVCLFFLGGVVLLEVLQNLTPDRHGRISDAMEKMAGGAIGILAARALVYLGRVQGWLSRNRGI